MVAGLNARFQGASPSSDLQRAGVLIHVFDGNEHTALQWLPCEPDKWCSKFGDRLTTSMVYAGHSGLFSGGPHGFKGLVFRPAFNRVLCSFVTDGGTMAKWCEPPGVSAECIPGCWRHAPGGGNQRSDWCRGDMLAGDVDRGCPYRPSDLQHMLETHRHVSNTAQFNEVVLDAAFYVKRLPYSLEAVIADREVHERFLQAYPEVQRHEVPLVRLRMGGPGGTISGFDELH